ncbi:MAG: transposase [Acidiferrobacterales bacterium]
MRAQLCSLAGAAPTRHSSANKNRLGPITKHSDSDLRTLRVHGACACLRVVDKKTDARLSGQARTVAPSAISMTNRSSMIGRPISTACQNADAASPRCAATACRCPRRPSGAGRGARRCR